MAQRLRVPVGNLSAGILTLSEEEGRYVAKVHRCKVGDALLLFDPMTGREAEAVLVGDRLPGIQVEALEPRAAKEANMPVTLLQGIGKGDKPEQAMRDVTVHGAQRLVLVQTRRSVARGEGTQRSERLLRVAAQVARQCERGGLPELQGPLSFSESLELAPPGLRLMCAWHEDARPLAALVRELNWDEESVTVLVGPEGGLHEDEVAEAMAAGFLPTSLGPYVLRAEVACGAVLSVLRAAQLASQ